MNRSTNFNFYLPTNADPMLVSDLTYNFEQIDGAMLSKEQQTLTDSQKAQARSNIEAEGSIYTEKGSFNSLESLSTALNNELGTMLNNEIRHIRLNCNGSFGIFYSGVAYFVDLKKSSMNYSSCMMQGIGYPSQAFGMLIVGTWSFESIPIGSFTVIETTVTTGPTGNIALSAVADSKTFVVGATVIGDNVFLRAWRAITTSGWYLTAVNPTTGATVNNTQLNIRYMVIKLP